MDVERFYHTLKEATYQNIHIVENEAVAVAEARFHLLADVRNHYKNILEQIAIRQKTEEEISLLMEKSSFLKIQSRDLDKQILEKKKELQHQDEKNSFGNQVVSLYRLQLALRIKKSKNGELSFIFSQIDKRHPDHCCVFNLVVEDNVYKLTKCAPKLEGLDELVTELNRTNCLSAFVIAMRRKFCGLLSGEVKPMP